MCAVDQLVGAEVIAGASTDDKLERLKAIGADHVTNYRQQPFADAVRKRVGKPRIAGGGGVDVVVNFTGGDTWLPSQRCVRVGGRILTYGATAGYAVTTDLRCLRTFEQALIGSHGWSAADLCALLALIAGAAAPPTEQRDVASPRVERESVPVVAIDPVTRIPRVGVPGSPGHRRYACGTIRRRGRTKRTWSRA